MEAEKMKSNPDSYLPARSPAAKASGDGTQAGFYFIAADYCS
jgi:hypothetical protein